MKKIDISKSLDVLEKSAGDRGGKVMKNPLASKSDEELNKELNILLTMDNNGGMLANNIMAELGRRHGGKKGERSEKVQKAIDLLQGDVLEKGGVGSGKKGHSTIKEHGDKTPYRTYFSSERAHIAFGNNPSRSVVEHYSKLISNKGIDHVVHYDMNDDAGGFKNKVHTIEFNSHEDHSRALEDNLDDDDEVKHYGADPTKLSDKELKEKHDMYEKQSKNPAFNDHGKKLLAKYKGELKRRN